MALNPQSNISSSTAAEALYQATRSNDPFPHIFPALLNSADIHDYIEATGMVYPYSPALMKSSSYEAEIGDRAIFWDQQGIKQTVDLSDGSEVTLEPNSLVYFETKQEFRLPDYIAIRFNLRITNVHRGLLLGTGPLVDPGFCGKLLIPIHNLTNVAYTFRGGEKFIWVEFTKISPHPQWHSSTERAPSQSGAYVPFPENKKWRKPSQYFEKANNSNPINNAVPVALQNANKNSRKAMSRVRHLTLGGAIAALAIVAGLFPLFYSSWELSSDSSKLVADFQKEIKGSMSLQQSTDEDITELRERLQILTGTHKTLKAESATIKAQLKSLKNLSDGYEALKLENFRIKAEMKSLRDEMRPKETLGPERIEGSKADPAPKN